MSKATEIIEYSKLVAEALGGEEILISSDFDISASGEYVRGFFAVSRKSICAIENGRVIFVKPIMSFNRICCGEYTGCGILEAFYSGGSIELVRFSMQYIEQFTAIAGVVNDIIAGIQPVLKDENYLKKELCPKCGRAFVKGTQICRFCTDKLGVLKKLWSLSKPCRPYYAVLLMLFWINSIVAVVSPALSKHLVNDVLSISGASVNKLILIVSFMLLCALVTCLAEVMRGIVSSKASNYLVRELRNHVFEKIQKMSLSYIQEKKTGDLIQRINNDTMQIQMFVQDIAIMAINEIFLFIAIAIVTINLNAVMSLLVFLPVFFSVFFINRIQRSIRARYMKQWRKMDKLTNRLTEVLNGIKLVKVFGRENDEIKLFNETAGIVRDITRKNEKYVYTIFPLIKFLMGLGSFFVLLYGGNSVLSGKMSVGELVQFSAYGSLLFSKIEWFAMLPRHFTNAVVSSQRIFEVIDESEEKSGSKVLSKENVEGSIDFENVSFGYKSYRKVLKNINRSVKKGEMIGLVGHSGAGKSTLINLVMRLYNPDSGEIMLDGENINQYRDSDYKEIIGVVLQENYLFSGTILDNIRYAKPDASVEECIDAAKKANAHDFIMSLPDAYDTQVGEKGQRLSGGERQRISIARAIILNPKILILDEATASVDTETELKIQDALSKVTDGKTVFAIAHRLSTLKNAHRLFVLEEGRIAESGTHKELIEKNGIYASLLKAQQEMAIKRVTIDNTDKEDSENIGKDVENEQD